MKGDEGSERRTVVLSPGMLQDLDNIARPELNGSVVDGINLREEAEDARPSDELSAGVEAGRLTS